MLKLMTFDREIRLRLESSTICLPTGPRDTSNFFGSVASLVAIGLKILKRIRPQDMVPRCLTIPTTARSRGQFANRPLNI